MLLAVIITVSLGVSGCTNEPRDQVNPSEQTIDFAGDTLDVHQSEIPVDLAVADRDGILVTYRVSAVSGTPRQPAFVIEDDILELSDPCPPMVFCDVRFEIEVPEGVTGLRDGEPTDITGD